MDNSKDRRKYLKLMWEVEKRLETLTSFNKQESDSLYLQCTIESEALQIRKILELIAYASLVAHKDAYQIVRKEISKDWHAERIINKIEGFNPTFYPVPVNGCDNKKWNKLKGGFLTKNQFLSLYDKCGAILHAKNPFSKIAQRSISFHKKVPDYTLKIENLLSQHLVRLANTNESLHVCIHFYQDKPTQARLLLKK
jgi:hypothetical protein